MATRSPQLLAFWDEGQERAFAGYYILRRLYLTQASLILAGLFFYIFFIYDRIIDPATADATHGIRAAMLCLFWGAAVLSWTKFGRHHVESICLVLGCLAAVALCVIFAMQRHGYYHGVAGYNFVVFFAAALFFVRLSRFVVLLAIYVAVFVIGQTYYDDLPIGLWWINLFYIMGAAVMALAIVHYREKASRSEFLLEGELSEEKAKFENLLYNVLPQSVALRLRNGQAVADAYADASVIFVDLVGSSQLARQLSPGHLIEVLNAVFLVGDRCAQRHDVEKVKTIGDAYLAVAGAALATDRAASIRFARDFLDGVAEIAEERQLELALRIGIHTGPVIGGVIGETRMTYDYWGDTMNVAARVQGAASPGGITVTEPTYFATRDFQVFEPARLITLKGIGETKVYDAIL